MEKSIIGCSASSQRTKMKAFEVRKIEEEDYPYIPAVYADSFEDDPWQDDWYDIPVFNQESTWVIIEDKEVLAFLISFISKNQPYLSVVAVKSNFQGKGLASKLIDTCMSYWRTEHYKELRVHVDHDKSNAINLYSKLGFKLIKKRKKDLYMSLNMNTV